MTARAEYSADEWQLLKATPYTVGMAVVFSDGTGMLESVRESIAAVVAQVEGLQRYPENELIKALANDRSTDATTSSARADLEGLKPDEAAARLRETALQDCGKVVVLLEDRSSEIERSGYLGWVMDVARAAALAARHGGLFSRGPLVDTQERSLLEAIADALGVDVGELPVEGFAGADAPPEPDAVTGDPGIPSGPISPE